MNPAWQAAPAILRLLILGLMILGCRREPPWNVLLVTFDTTRADALGCYGNAAARTPNLDRLAAAGTLFENAVSSNPVTLPSHSTIMTGTYPLVHGVRDNGTFSLPAERTTLAEVLAEAGYATAAAVGSFPLDHRFGLAQGFDLYDDDVTAAAENYEGERVATGGSLYFDERPAARVNDAILPWLRENAERPFFAWIHYWDPHQPHAPPAPFDQLFANDLYLGEIAYADQSLGVILDELAARGVADRTLVVALADHGEGFGEHREDTHSLLAYQTTLRVPLILKIPGRSGGARVVQRVGTVDVLPTILDLLGLTPPAAVQGRTLVPVLDRPDDGTDRVPYYAETLTPRLSHGWGELRALYGGNYKYIHGPRPELFDLAADPRELHDLAGEQPQESTRLRSALASFVAEKSAGAAADAVRGSDDETRRRLAALGYLASGGDAPESVSEELRDDGEPPQDRVVLNTLDSRLRSALAEQNYLSARDFATRLIELAPGKSFYRAQLVRAHVGLGQLEAAAEVALAADATEVGRHPENFLTLAERLFATGDRQRAFEITRRVADGDGGADAYYLLGEMYGDLGDDGARREALEKALEIDPSHPHARLAMAIYLAQTGSFEAAEAELSTLIQEHPLFARGHFNLGVLLLQGQRWQEAAERLERVTSIQPEYWQAYLARITAHLGLGQIDQAEDLARRLDSCPDPRVRQRARQLIDGAARR